MLLGLYESCIKYSNSRIHTHRVHIQDPDTYISSYIDSIYAISILIVLIVSYYSMILLIRLERCVVITHRTEFISITREQF